jgi:hypothetical protein
MDGRHYANPPPLPHTWVRRDRLLHIDVGSPHIFCYCDGVYLGTETRMDLAHKRCESNTKGDYVMEFETTEQVWKKLKPKPAPLAWTDQGKDTWHAPGDHAPARIRCLDEKTFAVYRDGQYLGCEKDLTTAKMRADINLRSQRNEVMRLWEQKHPGELPPGLQLTTVERAEYWRRNPPANTAVRTTAPKRRMEPEPVQVPENGGAGASSGPVATEPMGPGRNAPRGTAHNRRGTEKAVKPAAGAAKGTERNSVLISMLKRGCTREEVLRVTGWKAVSVQAMAKGLGLGLRVDKGSKPFRYYAEEK